MKKLFALIIFVSFLCPVISEKFVVALEQRNVDQLENAVREVSDPLSKNYGRYWSKDAIMSLVSQTDHNVNTVTNWLLENGVTNVQNYGDALTGESDSQTVEKLKYVPTYLQDLVVFVESETAAISRKRVRFSKSSDTADSHFVGREVVNRLYDIDMDVTCNQTSTCAVEYQGSSGFSQKDVDKHLSSENLPPNTVHAVGHDMPIPDMESQLDIQMMASTAPGTELWFWDDKGWLYTFALSFFNTDTIPSVISMSWGWAEDEQCAIISCSNTTTNSEYITRVNTEYMKIVLRGVTITVSSGDAGAPGRTSENCEENQPVNPVFPGSSPWVTSVGATFVVSSDIVRNWTTPFCREYHCATGDEERTCNLLETGWTAGGGFSIYDSERIPYWQKDEVEHYLTSGTPLPKEFDRGGRAYPDVSMVGHYCPVFNGRTVFAVDGTSCSSPLFASVVSIMNQHQLTRGRPVLGFVNPVLYSMARDGVFNDITVGNNSCTEMMCCKTREDGGSNHGFLSASGYDPVTGLGTPNVRKMLEWLDTNL